MARTIILTPRMLSNIITNAVSQGIREYEASKGGELSYNKALQLYGSWFSDAVAAGKISGIRRGDKPNSKRVFQTKDIEALREQEIIEAMRVVNYTHQV